MSLYFLINSLAGGGAERVALTLSERLDVKGIFLLEKDIAYRVKPERIIYLSEHTRNISAVLKSLYIPIYAYNLSKYLDKDSIVVSFLERANYVNVLASMVKKHKSIISVRMSQRMGRIYVHPYNLLTLLLYPKADKVVCVSNSIKSELIKLYRVSEDKLKVIYNPLDVDSIERLSKESLGPYESIFNYPVIITSGRLTKQKGQWYLLRIFKYLKKDFRDLKLVILGDGELKDYLITLSENLSLKTFVWDRDTISEDYDVYFLGFQKNPFKFIARAKLFVFPSLWEGLPNALIEAMACGVPVVSSDCRSGPREILAPETDFEYQSTEPEFAEYGVLMPVFEVRFKEAHEPLDSVETVWLETLKRVLSDKSLLQNYAQKAKIRAMDFHIDRIVGEWRDIILEVGER